MSSCFVRSRRRTDCAGLRVGHAIAGAPALATAIKQTQVPFAVTALGHQAALASLEAPAQDQMRARVAEVVAERERLRSQLIAVGYEIPPSQANFLWFPLGEASLGWAAGLEEQGVIGRPFAGAGVRVTVSSPAENELFLTAALRLAPPKL